MAGFEHPGLTNVMAGFEHPGAVETNVMAGFEQGFRALGFRAVAFRGKTREKCNNM